MDPASGMAGFRESDTTKNLDFPSSALSPFVVVVVVKCCLFVFATDATIPHLCLEC